ncbi:hypothetical protein ASG56_19260 [Rhodococcus sp. Leaf7]|uniref:prepilin peptidase n=1 Tax=unclassified Rhodococcus (in: high G+C Gram-positive bacteria) TaxID=192944 RepID=UPI0006FF00E0|nr:MULTISPECIES: A24 family peptidase [unclassified Rhodococcus (in: high G+C Gram-positive bacteria)]KQU02964.1 hypothetical protein ASG56_19260 [Rhodococcus sp. Leaf7]KQU38763.1 hypothetical protein ASG64_16745 [Rhodococcus sp. Leaf247]
MTVACVALIGFGAGWFAPTVVAQWIGSAGKAAALVCAVACAAVFAVACVVRSGDAFAAIGYWCVCLSLVDYSCRRLPDMLTLTGAGAVLAAAVWDGFFVAALVGGGLLVAMYVAVYLVSRGGVGFGDVKLALPLGAFAASAGGSSWSAAAMLAPTATAVLGVAGSGAGRGSSGPVDRAVPHGPSMCAATLVAWVSVGS